jgi:hypothetical protein
MFSWTVIYSICITELIKYTLKSHSDLPAYSEIPYLVNTFCGPCTRLILHKNIILFTDGTHLTEKDLNIPSHLGIANLSASNGQTDRFKKRHNIVNRTLSGESRSADPQTAEDSKKLPTTARN